MPSVPVLAAVALGAVAVLAGCGQSDAGISAGPPLNGSPSPVPPPAGSPPPASSPSPPPPRGAGHAGTCHGDVPPSNTSLITLTNADNGRLVCVRRGGAVRVYLKGTQTSRWSVIHATSGVLRPHATGHLMLALGVTGASFVATRPGTAAITSFRQVCPTPPPNSDVQSGVVECGTLLAFRVSVKVS
ncbi:MAG: hypothetical protein J2P30_28605 [Actinobacteria bacterium]|nr:hypothetical protein [Actinomycetota bacterium]